MYKSVSHVLREREESNDVVVHYTQAKLPPIPWKSILTSLPVWAIIITHTLNNFAWYMFLVELPTFMRLGLGFDIKSVTHWRGSYLTMNIHAYSRGSRLEGVVVLQSLPIERSSVQPSILVQLAVFNSVQQQVGLGQAQGLHLYHQR